MTETLAVVLNMNFYRVLGLRATQMGGAFKTFQPLIDLYFSLMFEDGFVWNSVLNPEYTRN